MPRIALLLFALAGLAGRALPAAEARDTVGLRVVRFYRPEHKQTRVRAFVQIPYALMKPSAAGPGGIMAYSVTITLTNSAGATLQKDTWRSRVVMGDPRLGPYAMDVLEFSVGPGRYRLGVDVRDSVSGRQAAAGIAVEGYSSNPVVSDLLLSPRMWVASRSDTIPRPGELRRGDVLVDAAVDPTLTPQRTKLHYLIEAYLDGQSEQAGAMYVTIADASGRTVLRSMPAAVRVPAGGGILRGQLDLEGLPRGHFTMTVATKLANQLVERSSGFTVSDSETPLRIPALTAREGIDSGYFVRMRGPELDSAFAPLLYIADESELGAYRKAPGVEGKRRFLTRFWQRRDPAPETAGNEARRDFYEAIAFANRTYGEEWRGESTPGWKTDRGRTYARHGAPDDVLRRRKDGAAPAYEIWRYSRGKELWFLFADVSGRGQYVMLESDDPKEPEVTAWREILTPAAVADVARFLSFEP